MIDLEERYDMRAAAAWVLGRARRTGVPELPAGVAAKVVDECDAREMHDIVAAGRDAGLALYPFKRSMRMLPRVRRSMGFLRSVSFESLLDVGSGRGVFLIPFVREFGWVEVTAIDVAQRRVTFLNELADGGYGRLHAELLDVCDQPYGDDSFDIVSMFEVLEHIPDVRSAVNAAVRMARQHVVVSVPSKPDDNPEHIHLLTKARLTELFGDAGCTRLRFDGVEGHLFMVATTSKMGR